jgi:hypothetical protein
VVSQQGSRTFKVK